MPRRKLALSNTECNLIFFSLQYVVYLLHYDYFRVKILDSIQTKALKDLERQSVKICDHKISYPELYTKGIVNFTIDRKFFRILDAFLEEIAESKSPALRTVSWRARHLRPLLNGFPAIFAAK